MEVVREGDQELVVDAAALALDRFLSALNRPAMSAKFVDEVLGAFLEHDRARRGPLRHFGAYLRHSGCGEEVLCAYCEGQAK